MKTWSTIFIVLLLAAATAFAVGVVLPPPDDPELEKPAYKRRIPLRDAALARCIAEHLKDCDVQVLCGEDRIRVTQIRIHLFGVPGYTCIPCHESTAFTRHDDILFVALFRPTSHGCKIASYDLRLKKRLWKTRLLGIRFGHPYSMYSNSVEVEMESNGVVSVRGSETAGSYLERLDAATGRILSSETSH